MGRKKSQFIITEPKIRTSQGGGWVTITCARVGGTARLINFMNGISVGIKTKRGSASAKRGLFRSGYLYSGLPIQLVIIIVTMVFLITSCSSPPLDNATSIPVKMTATEMLSTPTETPTLTPVPAITASPTPTIDIVTFRQEYHELVNNCLFFAWSVFTFTGGVATKPIVSSPDSQWIEDFESLSVDIELCADRLDAIEYPPGFENTHSFTLLATKELHNIPEQMSLFLKECVKSEDVDTCIPVMENMIEVYYASVNHSNDALDAFSEEAFSEERKSIPTSTLDT